MSTAYYSLAEPFSNLELIEKDDSDILRVFDDAGCCGTLVLKKGLGTTVALLFTTNLNYCTVLAYFGGERVGKVVEIYNKYIKDNDVIVSEHGVPTTLGKVKEGASRILKKY